MEAKERNDYIREINALKVKVKEVTKDAMDMFNLLASFTPLLTKLSKLTIDDPVLAKEIRNEIANAHETLKRINGK